METQENMIKTALQAAQKPFFEVAPNNTPLVFTPGEDGGWRYKAHPELMQNPYRKCGKFLMHDTASLIKFVQKHKQDGTQIYIDADFKSGRIDVTAVINGHTQQAPGWLDFYAVYTPQRTTSASNWLANNAHRMNQMEFSHFLTNNARNIVSKNPGNEMPFTRPQPKYWILRSISSTPKKPPSNKAIVNRTAESTLPSNPKTQGKQRKTSKCLNVSASSSPRIKAAHPTLLKPC